MYNPAYVGLSGIGGTWNLQVLSRPKEGSKGPGGTWNLQQGEQRGL